MCQSFWSGRRINEKDRKGREEEGRERDRVKHRMIVKLSKIEREKEGGREGELSERGSGVRDWEKKAVNRRE